MMTPVNTDHSSQGIEEEKGIKIPVLDGISSVNGMPTSLRVPPRMFHVSADVTAGPFAQWLEFVRKRSGMFRSSGFPNRRPKSSHSDEASDISLWERLGRAILLDIESDEFSWDTLSSLHHTEHGSDMEQSEDEMNKPLEVTVNSGGVVFFAIFKWPEDAEPVKKEAAAVIKISSSRMATLSERLGYEIAKWLGVRTPQARVVHNLSPEWQQIKDAAEKARQVAASQGDELCELTCSELLEALEMSRCLLLMNYVHGSPLLESSKAFDSKEAAERTAFALGRILLLDLVIRNEDRLPCHQLGWRGNSANLLYTDALTILNVNDLEEAFDSSLRVVRALRALQKERRSISMGSILGSSSLDLIPGSGDLLIHLPGESQAQTEGQSLSVPKCGDCHIVAIDSGVPRRPPSAKRASDQAKFPKFVEVILNSPEYASKILYEITGEKMGSANAIEPSHLPDSSVAVGEFQAGFRGALGDLQGFYKFLQRIYHNLNNVLLQFFAIAEKANPVDYEKEEVETESVGLGFGCLTPMTKERFVSETTAEITDSEAHRVGACPASTSKENPLPSSPMSRDNWHGRHSKGSVERLTIKLRDFSKYAKVDGELNKELDQWNELLRTELIKVCNENNFNTGFFEGTDNYVVDAYELKVRLEHILDRISFFSDAERTERPSMITNHLFIGGALAARSLYTLQHLGITHILCLCSNEVGQSDEQFPDLFEYKNFSIGDLDDSKISDLFDETSDFIEEVERLGKKVLVHCFEGKSRSATVILAYLMLRKGYRLLDAWNLLKKVHQRAQPNDGFARSLVDLDRRLHGKSSMEWQPRRPTVKVCPECGKNAGLSTDSLKVHMQKMHGKVSSGSVDSAMTMEIQKALGGLKITRTGSVSPTPKQFSS